MKTILMLTLMALIVMGAADGCEDDEWKSGEAESNCDGACVYAGECEDYGMSLDWDGGCVAKGGNNGECCQSS